MNKSKLKTGMWVEYRNGKRACVMLNVKTKSKFSKNIITDGTTWSDIDDFTDDLKYRHEDKNFDICKVYQPKCSTACYSGEKMELLWERKEEAKEITSEEAFSILKKHYGCEVKIKE